MDVVCLLRGSKLDKTFAEGARSAIIFDIKGHRSVSDSRASLCH